MRCNAVFAVLAGVGGWYASASRLRVRQQVLAVESVAEASLCVSIFDGVPDKWCQDVNGCNVEDYRDSICAFSGEVVIHPTSASDAIRELERDTLRQKEIVKIHLRNLGGSLHVGSLVIPAAPFPVYIICGNHDNNGGGQADITKLAGDIRVSHGAHLFVQDCVTIEGKFTVEGALSMANVEDLDAETVLIEQPYDTSQVNLLDGTTILFAPCPDGYHSTTSSGLCIGLFDQDLSTRYDAEQVCDEEGGSIVHDMNTLDSDELSLALRLAQDTTTGINAATVWTGSGKWCLDKAHCDESSTDSVAVLCLKQKRDWLFSSVGQVKGIEAVVAFESFAALQLAYASGQLEELDCLDCRMGLPGGFGLQAENEPLQAPLKPHGAEDFFSIALVGGSQDHKFRVGLEYFPLPGSEWLESSELRVSCAQGRCTYTLPPSPSRAIPSRVHLLNIGPLELVVHQISTHPLAMLEPGQMDGCSTVHVTVLPSGQLSLAPLDSGSSVGYDKPPDLRLDFAFSGSCDRLTRWVHPYSGGDFKLVVNAAESDATELAVHAEYLEGWSGKHEPSLSRRQGSPTTWEVTVIPALASALPAAFRIYLGNDIGQESSTCITSISLQRFGKLVNQVSAQDLYSCDNFCAAAHASSECLHFAHDKIQTLTLSFPPHHQQQHDTCSAVDEVQVFDEQNSGELKDGVEACTTYAVYPAYNYSDSKTLQEYLHELKNGQTTKDRIADTISGIERGRSLNLVHFSSSRLGDREWDVPQNRRLILGWDETSSAPLTEGRVRVSGTLELDGVHVSDGTVLTIAPGGSLLANGCSFDQGARVDVLPGAGVVRFSGSSFKTGSQISHKGGENELFVEFSAFDSGASIQTSPTTFNEAVKLLGLELEDLGALPARTKIHLLDVERTYEEIFEPETHSFCSDADNDQHESSAVLDQGQETIASCESACENAKSCLGYHFSLSSSPSENKRGADSLKEQDAMPAQALCQLCLAADCSLDCSSNVDGSLFIASADHLAFYDVSSFLEKGWCPEAISSSSSLSHLSAGSLRECQALCAYHSNCALVRWEDNKSLNGGCALYESARGTTTDCGAASQNGITFWAYDPGNNPEEQDGDFVHLTGACLNGRKELARTTGGSSGACSTMCKVFFEFACLSFDFDPSTATCTFFSSRGTASRTCTSDQPAFMTFARLPDRFPVFEDLVQTGCFLKETANTLGWAGSPLIDQAFLSRNSLECRTRCDSDDRCAAFQFNSKSATCSLFNEQVYLEIFFGNACEPVPSHDAGLVLGATAISFLTEHLDDDAEIEKARVCQAGGTGGDLFSTVSVGKCKSLCILFDNCVAIRYNSSQIDTECALLDAGTASKSCALPTHAKLSPTRSIGAQGTYIQLDACIAPGEENSALMVPAELEISDCQLLCDIHPSCILFLTDNAGECLLYGGAALDLPSSCAANERKNVAVQVERKVDLLPLHHYLPLIVSEKSSGLTVAFRHQRIISDSAHTLVDCLLECATSNSCQAVEFDSLKQGSGACAHRFGGASFEAVDDVGSAANAYFIRHAEFLYEAFPRDSKVPQSSAKPILSTKSSKTGDGCRHLCSSFVPCKRYTHDSQDETCSLFTDMLPTSVDEDRVEQKRVSGTLPFVEILTGYCAKPAALIASFGGGDDRVYLRHWQCASICHALSHCGFYVHSQKECHLYSIDSWVTQDCAHLAPDARTFVSYERFSATAAQEYLDMTERNLCFGPETVTTDLTISSVVECEATCAVVSAQGQFNSTTNGTLPERNCNGFLFDEANGRCSLVQSPTRLIRCNPSSADGVRSMLAFQRADFSAVPSDRTLESSRQRVEQQCTSKEQGAALCEAWLDCSAFEFDGTTCTLHASPVYGKAEQARVDLELYEYFSLAPLTKLDKSYCIAANSAMLSLEGLALEACKNICMLLENCEAMEHAPQGQCFLYSINKFYPCQGQAATRDLYISFAAFLDEPEFKFVELVDTAFHKPTPQPTPKPVSDNCQSTHMQCQLYNGCNFLLPGKAKDDCCRKPCPSSLLQIEENSLDLAACADACNQMPATECAGYSRDMNTGECLVFTQDEAKKPLSQSQGTITSLRYKSNPYMVLVDACLTEPLDTLGPFWGKTWLECRAICQAADFCQHFKLAPLRGGKCSLYKDQPGKIAQTCQDAETDVYWNSRSFINQASAFGVPKTIFASVPALSYDECASACALTPACGAFIHDWGLKRAPSYGQLLGEPTRLITVTEPFRPYETYRFLTVDATSMTDVTLVEGRHTDYQLQELVLETLLGEGEFSIRFLYLDLCLAAGSSSKLIVEACDPTNRIKQRFKKREPHFFSHYKNFGAGEQVPFSIESVGNEGQCVSTPSNGVPTLVSCVDRVVTGLTWDLASRNVRLVAPQPASALSTSDEPMCLGSFSGKLVLSLVPCHTLGSSAEGDFYYVFGLKSWTGYYGAGSFCIYPNDDKLGWRIAFTCGHDGPEILLGENGRLVKFSDPNQCLTADLRFEPCSSKTRAQVEWRQYSVCSLSTYEESEPIKLELKNAPGKCLGSQRIASPDLGACVQAVSCATAPSWIYHYGADQLRSANSQCLTRTQNDDLDFTGCDESAQSHSRVWFLGGQDHSQLEYRSLDDTTFCILGDATKSCLNSGPACEMQKSPGFRDYSRPLAHLGLRPEAATQEITDEKILYQAWLWSDFGRPARGLLSAVERLVPAFERVEQALNLLLSGVQDVSSIIYSKLGPLLHLEGKLSGWETMLRACKYVLKLFSMLPYIGPVIKQLQLPSIVNTGQKLSGKMVSAIKRSFRGIRSVQSSLGMVENQITTARGFTAGLAVGASAAAETLVSLMACAFFDLGPLSDTSIKIGRYMDDLKRAVELGVTLADQTVGKILPALEKLRRMVDDKLIKPINTMIRALRPMDRMMNLLATLLEWQAKAVALRVPKKIKPRFECRRILRCKLRVYVDYYYIDVGLVSIGNALGKVERFIKRIPFVGFLWGVLERQVDKLMARIVPSVALGFPAFGFLDRIESALLAPIIELRETVEEALGAIPDAFTLAVETLALDSLSLKDFVTTNLFGGLPNILPYDCDTISCLVSVLAERTGSIGVIHEALGYPGWADAAVGFLLALEKLPAQIAESTYNLIGSLLKSWGECTEWASFPLPGVHQLAQSLGLGEKGCSLLPKAVEVCVGVKFSGTAADISKTIMEEVESSVEPTLNISNFPPSRDSSILLQQQKYDYSNYAIFTDNIAVRLPLNQIICERLFPQNCNRLNVVQPFRKRSYTRDRSINFEPALFHIYAPALTGKKMRAFSADVSSYGYFHLRGVLTGILSKIHNGSGDSLFMRHSDLHLGAEFGMSFSFRCHWNYKTVLVDEIQRFLHRFRIAKQHDCMRYGTLQVDFSENWGPGSQYKKLDCVSAFERQMDAWKTQCKSYFELVLEAQRVGNWETGGVWKKYSTPGIPYYKLDDIFRIVNEVLRQPSYSGTELVHHKRLVVIEFVKFLRKVGRKLDREKPKPLSTNPRYWYSLFFRPGDKCSEIKDSLDKGLKNWSESVWKWSLRGEVVEHINQAVRAVPKKMLGPYHINLLGSTTTSSGTVYLRFVFQFTDYFSLNIELPFILDSGRYDYDPFTLAIFLSVRIPYRQFSLDFASKNGIQCALAKSLYTHVVPLNLTGNDKFVQLFGQTMTDDDLVAGKDPTLWGEFSDINCRQGLNLNFPKYAPEAKISFLAEVGVYLDSRTLGE